MRIGGEAPRRRTHSRKRCQHHGLLRVTATSDHHRNRRCCVRQAPIARLLPPVSPLTLLVIRRQPEPRRWSPGATEQLATCAPEPRSLSCVFLPALSVRVRYHWLNALFFWKSKKRQANWIMPRRTRALPALASPFSRRLLPLSSGAPVRPAQRASARRSRNG